jgi:hypothetical protein
VMSDWLAANRGLRLQPVFGTMVQDLPAGVWLALEARSPTVVHAVLARGATAIHDPGGGEPLHLWANLARRQINGLPLGYRIVAA